MGERYNPEQLNAEDWDMLSRQVNLIMTFRRVEELTIERIEEMINEHQFKELKEELKNNMYPG